MRIHVILTVAGVWWVLGSLVVALDAGLTVSESFASSLGPPPQIAAAEEAGIGRVRLYWVGSVLEACAMLAINAILAAILAWQLLRHAGSSVVELLRRVPWWLWLVCAAVQFVYIPRTLELLAVPENGDDAIRRSMFNEGIQLKGPWLRTEEDWRRSELHRTIPHVLVLMPFYLGLAVWCWRVGPLPKSLRSDLNCIPAAPPKLGEEDHIIAASAIQFKARKTT